jgi:hypothetical protein
MSGAYRERQKSLWWSVKGTQDTGETTYVESIIVTKKELELSSKIAHCTSHDTKEYGRRWI